MKYLNQFELHAMLADLDLGAEASWDWLILLTENRLDSLRRLGHT